jgi:hypothetical protein
MKKWQRINEWMDLARCGDSDIHTMENPSETDCLEAKAICGECLVRPECIEWAIREKACSVFVAGIYLPDPSSKRELKLLYIQLEQSIPAERALIGDV